jgi:hypothetical protein
VSAAANRRVPKAARLLAAVAALGLLLAACGGERTPSGGDAPAPPSSVASAQEELAAIEAALLTPQVLEATVGTTTAWRAVQTASGRWVDLQGVPAPCGQRVTIPDQVQVLYREFAAGAAAAVSELAVVTNGDQTMDVFKRIYAECELVGKVAGVDGPRVVARPPARAGLEAVEMTTMAGPVVVVVRGQRPASAGEPSDAELLRLSTTASERLERALNG